MADPISFSALGYFMPVFAFLLVFVVLYALLKKTGVLSDNEPIMIFVSLIMASFFIVEVSLVDFIQFSSAWFVTLVMIVFFILLLLAFMPGKEPLAFLSKSNWFSWVLLVLMVVIFIVSSAYVFHWAINWDSLWERTGSDWFGFILLMIIAGVVAFTIRTKK